MFFFDAQRGDLLSEYRNPRPTNDTTSPTTGKYCSSHLGIPVPARDRYLLVNAYYRGGSSVIDFSDPTEPKEIAFADMEGTNTWSAYTYPRRSGTASTIPVYSNDGLSRNYGTAAAPRPTRRPRTASSASAADVGRTNLVGLDRLNPQLQEQVDPDPPRAEEAAARQARQARPRPPGRRPSQPVGAPLGKVGSARSTARARGPSWTPR